MKRLLSLPPNVVACFHDITNTKRSDFFCTSDPVGRKLGSGGGTAWLLEACHRDERPDENFEQWLKRDKRILLHAGGQIVTNWAEPPSAGLCAERKGAYACAGVSLGAWPAY